MNRVKRQSLAYFLLQLLCLMDKTLVSLLQHKKKVETSHQTTCPALRKKKRQSWLDYYIFYKLSTRKHSSLFSTIVRFIGLKRLL
ncbi:hypothetical protein BD560DRAFT_405726, partial [Blakeslea trispora]